MDFDQIEMREMDLLRETDLARIDAFLGTLDLQRDELDYYIGLFDGPDMVAGGGYFRQVIKCVGVAGAWRETGLTNRVISHLYSTLIRQGQANVFVFTKPENAGIFENLGFHLVGSATAAVLLESSPTAISDYVRTLSLSRTEGVNGAIVVNCNPFTLGHLYLIEQAAEQCDHLHLFVVSEDRSVFPFDVRYELVQKGTAHLKNVMIHPGGDYIISSATFPSYFLKKMEDIVQTHAALDVNIFGRHIAPALGLAKRFVGEEPLDPVTNQYNAAMQAILPGFGIELIVIPRKSVGDQPISASLVRRLAAAGRFDELRQYVPQSTYDFLVSERAVPIIRKIAAAMAGSVS